MTNEKDVERLLNILTVEQLRELLKKVRERRNIKKSEFAKLLGTTQPNYHFWENSSTNQLGLISFLMKAGVTVEDVAGIDGSLYDDLRKLKERLQEAQKKSNKNYQAMIKDISKMIAVVETNPQTITT